MEYGAMEWHPSARRVQLLCDGGTHLLEAFDIRHHLPCHLFVHVTAVPSGHGMHIRQANPVII